MSTACTHDLSALERRQNEGGEQWASAFTTSLYKSDGTVLKGPAVAPLPYYDLRLEAGVYGGLPDTLFVHVGVERPAEWRLKAAPSN